MKNIICPNCNNQMDRVVYEFSGDYIVIYKNGDELEKIYKSYKNIPENVLIEIDRCNNCGGIWFDKGEYEKLTDLEHSNAIEEGVKAVKNNLGSINEKRSCPHCNIPLHSKEETESLLRYEYCSQCEGLFLDQGEFSDNHIKSDKRT